MSFSRRQFVQDVTGWTAGRGPAGSNRLGRRGRPGAGPSDRRYASTPVGPGGRQAALAEGSPDLLNRRYAMPEYLEATRGLNVVKAVYMEVDVDPRDHVTEAEHVIGLCRSKQHPTVAAVIGGRPASDKFAEYVARFKGSPYVKGVRQVLHGGTPAGYCLTDEYRARHSAARRRGAELRPVPAAGRVAGRSETGRTVPGHSVYPRSLRQRGSQRVCSENWRRKAEP